MAPTVDTDENFCPMLHWLHSDALLDLVVGAVVSDGR